MKKILFPFALAALIFSGCSDDDNAGNGGENGSDKLRKISLERSEIDNLPSTTTIDMVHLVVGYGEDREYSLEQVPFNNGFSMTLPSTVSNTYLTSVTEVWSDEDYESSDITISHTSAMVTAYTEFEVYNDNVHRGYFYAAEDNDNDDRWKVDYVYSDRDVTIKGKRTYSIYDEDFDLRLKQGWNRVASRETHDDGKYKYEAKTNLPNKLQWYFATTSEY